MFSFANALLLEEKPLIVGTRHTLRKTNAFIDHPGASEKLSVERKQSTSFLTTLTRKRNQCTIEALTVNRGSQS